MSTTLIWSVGPLLQHQKRKGALAYQRCLTPILCYYANDFRDSMQKTSLSGKKQIILAKYKQNFIDDIPRNGKYSSAKAPWRSIIKRKGLVHRKF